MVTMNVDSIKMLPIVFALFAGPAFCADSWLAGAGRVNITPEEPLWMAGYAARSAPADGKTTDLWAKTLVLDDQEGNRGVVITLDLVGIDRNLSRRVCKRLEQSFGIERHQITICTSHTHSGPVVGRNLGPLHYLVLDVSQQERIDAYADRLISKIESAVDHAIQSMEPSRMQWGNGHATFAVNRRENKPYPSVPKWRDKGELKGPVDHDVPVLSVRSKEGDLRAVLFGYACHATTVSFNQWSGDYPGYAQMELEKKHPGCVALFWAGCGADQNPLPRRTVELAQQYGVQLAAAVDAVLSAPMQRLKPSLSVKYQEVDVALQQLPDADAIDHSIRSTNRYEAARAKALKEQLAEKGSLDDRYPYPVGVWVLGGEVDFIHLGGEVVVDYAIRLKMELRGNQTWVAGYANDVMAYIPSRRVLREGGYEGGGSNVYYGLPGLWDETAEATIINAVRALTLP